MSRFSTKSISPDLEAQIEILNKKLVDYLLCYPYGTKELLETAIYAVEAPAHRWRPILFLTIYNKLSSKPEHNVIAIACAIEFLHTASMILDDLPSMDNGLLRRGKNSCHIQFSQSRAILTANWICDVAQFLIHEFQSHNASKPYVDLENCFRLTKNAMMKGQVLDLEKNTHTYDEIIEMYSLKSGALYAFASSVPAIIVKSPRLIENLKSFGNSLGIAYQISDDIHDMVDTSDQLGKDVRKDENKSTIPRLQGIGRASELKDLYKMDCVSALKNILDQSDDLIDLVERICF